MDSTGKALVEFWKWAGDKGLVNASTASAKGTACAQVLGAMDNWEKLDVSALNVDDVFRRFTNKRNKDFTPASLATYKSRFQQALADFLEYKKNPESWKPKGQDRAPRKEKAAAAAKNGNGHGTPDIHVVDQQPGRPGLVEYPFPLREGRFAYLKLPADLKMADVKRLTAYLNTLPDDSDIS